MLTPEQAVLVSLLTCIAGAALTLLVSRSKLVAGWLAFPVTAGDSDPDSSQPCLESC